MAKSAREKIRLVSSAGTGHFYTTDKNKRNMPEKMEIKKYDPTIRKHVIYKEAKIKQLASDVARKNCRAQKSRHMAGFFLSAICGGKSYSVETQKSPNTFMLGLSIILVLLLSDSDRNYSATTFSACAPFWP